jgi:hypothetical protein
MPPKCIWSAASEKPAAVVPVAAQGNLATEVAEYPGKQPLLWRNFPVKNPLDSLWGTVICGVILTVVLYFVANAIMPHGA